jgi:hypothetical protein
MRNALKFVLPLLLVVSPAAAQPADPGGAPLAPEVDLPPEKSGPVTRQTANRESPLLDFEYSWPEAITPEPQLVALLQDDLSKNYDEATNTARENKVLMEQNNGSFHQNSFTRAWALEGETPLLYSLVSKTDTFTGGAHPNHTSSALLWDRSTDGKIELADLFQPSNGLENAVRASYCKLLDAERLKRRQGEKLDGEFGACPAFKELTIAPAGARGAGPLNSLKIIADPYVAGPYSEGDYEISVPVTADLIAALKPEYRGDFAAQRAQ